MKVLSPLLSIARGSVAGVTGTANPFAQIVFRARTAPVQPGTVNQTKIKSAFAAASALWNSLTPIQRQGWIDYADSLTFLGPVGTYKVPGRQIFLSNYGWAAYLQDRAVPGVAASQAPPINLGFLALGNVNVAPPSAGVGFKVTGNNPNPESIDVIVMVSRAFNPSRNRYKGPFKSDVIWSDSVISMAGFDVSITGLIEDARYFCSVRGLSIDGPNRLSAKSFLTSLASAAA